MIRIRRVLTIFLSIVALLYLAVMGAAFALQRSVLFPAPRSPLQEPSSRPGFQRLTPSGGPVVDVLHLPAGPGQPTMPESTVLSSRSVGGGVAVEMARRGHGARLVLLAPFTSVADMAHRVFPFLPTRLLVRDRFDNAAKAPGIGIPVLILHGHQDEIIPVEMGQQLGRLFPRSTLEVIPGAHHNDLLERTWPVLVDRIAVFARM